MLSSSAIQPKKAPGEKEMDKLKDILDRIDKILPEDKANSDKIKSSIDKLDWQEDIEISPELDQEIERVAQGVPHANQGSEAGRVNQP